MSTQDMAKSFIAIALLGVLQGCSYTVANYIRNDASDQVVVSIQRERADLGLERRESDSIEVEPHTICSFGTNPGYDFFLYIRNESSGESTNISLLEGGNLVYTVQSHGQKQVVSIQKADKKTRTLGKKYGVNCRNIAGIRE